MWSVQDTVLSSECQWLDNRHKLIDSTKLYELTKIHQQILGTQINHYGV